ncbi:MAG TPA: response regulator [Aliidongia sp.]|uniref:response regulator n=1 Tax=Aliidongia sp. TaxID=1914230 RepID=UPI002DDD1497|nr:response regulator [Aliidongia sp.]HEV2677676.1 response regulator [Aliidongia sp.]
MSISSKIAPHLPYLRRFARALAGSQASGDAYAVATLQTLVEEPTLLADGEDVRIGLYHLLLRVWSTMPVNDLASGTARGSSVDGARQSLEAMTPRSRIAFLLTAVDGLSPDQVAKVLSCSPAEARTLIATAQEQLAQQMATDVLIIEDEPIIAMDLESLVESQGHRVIGVAATHGEALELVRKQRPGLVLADIQLADGSSGLDAVNDILKSFDVPVIFVTAFPEQLLTGERPEPAFLVTKPFRIEALKAVIGQALFFSEAAPAPAR